MKPRPRRPTAPRPYVPRVKLRRRDRLLVVVTAGLVTALYLVRVPGSHRVGPAPRFGGGVDFELLETSSGVFCPDPARLPLARVLGVVDGDTLRVDGPDGPEFLRYFGCDTPERDQSCYAEATERNRRLAGAAVRLAFDARRHDPHGRLLAYAFTPDGRSIDAQLIAEGWARAWRRDGAFRFRLERLEARARAARVGCLWGGRKEAAP